MTSIMHIIGNANLQIREIEADKKPEEYKKAYQT